MADNAFDPQKEFAAIRDTVSKALNSSIRNVQSIMDGSSRLLVDIYEHDGQLVLSTSPVDGLVASSLSISANGDTLTLSGTTSDPDASSVASYFVQERRFGDFARLITLPVPTDASRARATVRRNGTIVVTIPVMRSSVAKIEVEDDASQK
jgi:HSP20 family molecular chaperone IbpA